MRVEDPDDLSKENTPDLSEARKRLPLNLVSNVAWLGLNVVVSFLYIPFLIDKLGIAAYGIVPLTASVTKYMMVITQGFNSSVSRYLTIDLARDDMDAANGTFNTAVAASILMAAVLAPFVIAFAYFSPQIFNVPAGSESSARWMMQMTMAAFIITTMANSFAVSSFAYHRFDLRFLINAARLLTEVGIAILLFLLLSPQIWQVGIGIFMASLVFMAGNVWVWRKLTPQLHLMLNKLDWHNMREMLSFSGWIMINQVGSLMFLNIDLIVANLIFGAVAGGRYGAIIIFPVTLRSIAATINGVLAPVIFTLYAQNRFSDMVSLSKRAVKYFALVMALPIGLICGLSIPLLILWLGNDFSDLNLLVIVLLGHLCINIAVTPLLSIQVVTNKVKIPAIVTLVAGGINVILAVILAKYSNWGLVSIAFAGAIVLTARNAVFTPWYAAKISSEPWYTFFVPLFYGAIGFLFVFGLGIAISRNIAIVNWASFIMVALGISTVYFVLVSMIGISRNDRQLILAEIRQKVNK